MKSNEKRREALRKILGAGVIGGSVAGGARFMPAKWAEPVIDSLVLPAHAAASGSTTTAIPPTTT